MKKFINLRTPLFLGISLIMGILFAYCVYFCKVIPAILIAGAFVVAIIFYIKYSITEGKKKTAIILSSIFLIFSIFGSLSFFVKVNNFNKADLDNHIVTVSGRVSSINEKDGYKNLILTNVSISSLDKTNTKYKVSVTYFGLTEVELGDRLNYTALLSDRTLFYKGKFNVYDIGNGIKYSSTIEEGEYQIIKNSPNLFERIRIGISNILFSGLDNEEFSVVFALLTGNSDYIENNTLANFRASGVAHIFAVSGLHIGFLSAVLAFIFDKLKLNKILRAVIIISCLLLYSGVCGFSASSLRATIMCAVMLIASISGERYDGVSALGVALTILLIIFPLQLFFVGFQLSFAVVFAILTLTNPLSKLFKKLPSKLANALAGVIVAQLVSMPIMLIHFGAFSIISVLANLIFLPVVSVIFILSLISVLLAGIFSAPFLLVPLGFVIKGIVFLINALDLTVFMVGGFIMGVSTLFYYLTLLVLSGMINLEKNTIKILSIVFVSIFALTIFVENFSEFSKTKIYSIASDNLCVSIISHKNDDALIITYSKSDANFEPVIEVFKEKGISKIEKVFILSNNNVDAQEVCSSLIDVVKIDCVNVYGEVDERLYWAMNKSFPEVLLSFDSGASIGDIYIEYLFDGSGLMATRKGKNALFIGALDESENYSMLNKLTTWFSIVFEAEDFIYSQLSAKNKFTYHHSYTYDSASEVGTLIYYLK